MLRISGFILLGCWGDDSLVSIDIDYATMVNSFDRVILRHFSFMRFLSVTTRKLSSGCLRTNIYIALRHQQQ